MIRRRVIAHGLVQGVWYRETTRREAERHGVAGWVRNRPDGTVEAVLEGERAAVEHLLVFARIGPARAVVTRVEVTAEEPEGLSGFSVR